MGQKTRWTLTNIMNKKYEVEPEAVQAMDEICDFIKKSCQGDGL